MKKILFLVTLFTLLFTSVSSAQEKDDSKQKRIAFVNKHKFEDEEKGILKLTKAIIAANDLGFIGETDPQKRKKIYEEGYKKRSKFVVEPIEREISALLKEIEKQNNLTILDGVELDKKGLILGFSNALDISEKAILLANEYFRTGSIQSHTIVVPNAKIATISTKALVDEKAGIKRINEKIRETENLIKNKTGKNPTFDEVKEFLMKDQSKENLFYQIGNFIQSYAEKNDFGAVFDSSEELPAELRLFPAQDVTKDFISYYNQMNQ